MTDTKSERKYLVTEDTDAGRRHLASEDIKGERRYFVCDDNGVPILPSDEEMVEFHNHLKTVFESIGDSFGIAYEKLAKGYKEAGND